MTLKEYQPGTTFPGVIGRTVSESEPAWPQPVRAKKGAPNVRGGKGTPGRGQLYINGELVGICDFPVTVPIVFGIEGLSCGYDFGEAVTYQYTAPFRFTGKIRKVVTDLSGDLIVDDEARVRLLMAQQ